MSAPDAVAVRLAHLERITWTVFALAEVGREILYAGEEGGAINAHKLEAVLSAIALIADDEAAAEALEALKKRGDQ